MDTRTHLKTTAARKSEATRIVPETPADDELAVGMLIGRARTTLLTNLDAELEQFALTGAQYAVLKTLVDVSDATAADLSRAVLAFADT